MPLQPHSSNKLTGDYRVEFKMFLHTLFQMVLCWFPPLCVNKVNNNFLRLTECISQMPPAGVHDTVCRNYEY